MSKEERGKLFELHNGDWIYLDSVTALIFHEKWEVGDTTYPAGISVERKGLESIQIEFDDSEKAKNCRSELAGKINTFEVTM